MEGHALLELGTPEILMQTFWMSSQDATTLATCINDLGDLNSISILAEVSNEVDSIRSSGESSQKTESLTDSLAAFFGVKTQMESSVTSISGQHSTFHGHVHKHRSNRKKQLSSSGMGRKIVDPAGEDVDVDQHESQLIKQGPLVGNVSIVTPSSNNDVENVMEWNDSSDESEVYNSGKEHSEDSSTSSDYNPKGFITDPNSADHEKIYSNLAQHKMGNKLNSLSYHTGNVDGSEHCTESHRSGASFDDIEDPNCGPGSDTIAGGVAYVSHGESNYGDESDQTSFIGEKQHAYKIQGHEETDSDRRSNSMCESDYGEESLGRYVNEFRYRRNSNSRKSKSKQVRRKKGRSRRIREEVSDDNDDEDEEMAYKVVMVGIVGVGKKSLMKRFGGAEFSSSEVSKMSKHFVSSDVERYMIKSWDDKGQEVREKLTENRRSILPFTKKADILMVVYDITNVLSFRYLPDILEQIISSGTTPWMSLVLVGNKIDLDWEDGARQVSHDMAFDLCRRYGFGLNFETSAKAGTNVTELLSVALSRCEQDRIRELNTTIKNDYTERSSNNQGEQTTLAQNVASFFGIGTGTRREINHNSSDIHSIRVGAKTEFMSTVDESNTQYSSRFGPVTSYGEYTGDL